MLETVVLLAFVLALTLCVFTGASILYALAAGYLIFFSYGLMKGHKARTVFQMSLKGVKTVKNILMIFGLIGLITALWRASGTIPVIVCYASRLIVPSAFILITFLLNCMLSLLTGTSFGTSATMGVICMSMGNALQMNPMYVGGAILAGAFWGDRCSPVSSSANLVCNLTNTDLFDNIREMIKTGWVPTVLSCIVYFLLGHSAGGGTAALDVEGMFSENFILHWSAVIPAASILILAAFKVPVKRTLFVSIVLAFICCLTLQKLSVTEILPMLVVGYKTENPQLAAMINGGGLVSMVRATCIVSLSSSYAGMFEGTGLLTNIQHKIENLGKKITSFGITLLVSVLASMVSCNQTLATMLTSQLCKGTEPDEKKFAITLEDTAIILSPLVPWSIASAVPLGAVGAPMISIVFACYLYFQPLWSLILALREKKKMNADLIR